MKHNRGFTLIELLVVIAIVGIMSAIVLSQLNTARSKGNDAAARSAFRNLGNVGVIYYYDVNNESYNGICTNQASPAKFNQIWSTITGATCNMSSLGYRVLAPLQQCNVFGSSSGCDDYLCADASGNLKVLDSLPGNGLITC